MITTFRAVSYVLLALGITVTLLGPSVSAADDPAAVTAIEKLKGSIRRDDSKPGDPIFDVVLFTPVADEDLIHLKGLPDLKSLGLQNSKITNKGLKHIAKLTNLEALDIGNQAITDDGLEYLKDLKNLKTLILSGNLIKKLSIKGPGLVHLKGLTKLEYLSLNDTEVGDEALVHLEALKSLKTLNVTGSHVTEAGLSKLKKSLPGLK